VSLSIVAKLKIVYIKNCNPACKALVFYICLIKIAVIYAGKHIVAAFAFKVFNHTFVTGYNFVHIYG